MSAWSFVVFNCWAFSCAALLAGESGSTNAAKAGRARVVILGDSITAGYGLEPAEAYPALLQEKVNAARLPYEIVNAGVSGDTTAGGLRRVDWSLRGGAAVLVVALGGNDGLRGLPPTETAGNLAAIIRRARAKAPGIEVVMAGMEMPASFGAAYVQAYRETFPKVAKEESARLVPFLLAGVGGLADLNQGDRIHPNAAGQRIVAENVWKVLGPILKKN